MFIVFKYLTTAFVIVAVSEFAKRSDRLGSLIASLPLVTVLTLIWLNVEKQSVEKISNHAYYTFWYVIPTLPMFLVFPYLMTKFNFWISLTIFIISTILIFWLYAIIMKRFGIDLI
jgi:hypothetical protein